MKKAIYELNSATCTDEFDFEINELGFLSVEETVEGSASNILKLDLNSNRNWHLDADYGINWINEANTGLLQKKSPIDSVVVAVHDKIINTDGIMSVKEIKVSKGLNRKFYIEVIAVSVNGSEVKINKEVITK